MSVTERKSIREKRIIPHCNTVKQWYLDESGMSLEEQVTDAAIVFQPIIHDAKQFISTSLQELVKKSIISHWISQDSETFTKAVKQDPELRNNVQTLSELIDPPEKSNTRGILGSEIHAYAIIECMVALEILGSPYIGKNIMDSFDKSSSDRAWQNIFSGRNAMRSLYDRLRARNESQRESIPISIDEEKRRGIHIPHTLSSTISSFTTPDHRVGEDRYDRRLFSRWRFW